MISNRLYGLDFFRLLAVLMVFFFHSSMHMGIDYGVVTSFIRSGAIFMTAFFILSGFVIRYVSVSYSGGDSITKKTYSWNHARLLGIMFYLSVVQHYYCCFTEELRFIYDDYKREFVIITN